MRAGSYITSKRTVDRQIDYDRQGFLLHWESYSGDLVESGQQQKSCDTMGRVLMHQCVTTTEKHRWRYRYDRAGHCVGALAFSNDQQTPDHSYLFVYDAGGRLTDIREYDVDHSLVTRTIQRYDVLGRLAAIIGYSPDGNISYKHEFSFYNDHGDPTVDTYHVGGEHTCLWRRQHSYLYDAHGSWTKQTISNTLLQKNLFVLQPYKVIYRSIAYY